MDITKKRRNKCLDKKDNRIGNKKDHLKLKWNWDKEFENTNNKKFIRTIANIDIYKLTVERIRRWRDSNHNYYVYTIYIDKKYINSFHDRTLIIYEKERKIQFNTRIDAQLEAEKYLIKHLNSIIKEFNGD